MSAASLTAASLKDPRLFLLNTSPTILDQDIKTSKLQTNRQVIISFLAHHDEMLGDGKSTIREAAKETTTIDESLYKKANIPTVSHHKICEKIESYYKEMQTLIKIPKNVWDKGKSFAKIEKFKINLEKKTFAFWPRDALDRIPNEEEDRQFLLNMMGPRTASLGVLTCNSQ